MARKAKTRRPPVRLNGGGAEASSTDGSDPATTLWVLYGLAVHPRIISPALRVLLCVYGELNPPDRFQPVKQEWIARQVRISQPAVSQILQTLVVERFLEVGPKCERANTYRVHPQVLEAAAASKAA